MAFDPLSAFTQALAARPFITGQKPEAAMAAFEKYAAQGRGNEGDWVNWAIADMGWDAGSAEDWQAHVARHAPSATPASGTPGAGPRYQKGGVDAGKWSDPNHKSAKYELLRILDQVDPQTLGREGLLKLPENVKAQLAAAGFKIVDEDKISRADIGEVDALHGKRDEYGYRLTKNPDGSVPKGPGVVSPPGGTLPPGAPGDLIGPVSPDDGGAMKRFLDGGGMAGDSGNPGGGIDPSYLAPWTEAFQGVGQLPTWNYDDFNAPTADSMYADPGYKFRVDEGTRALQQSAAARGHLRTGGTLKDIVGYGQAAASQEYPNVFNRALTAYTTNRQNSQGAFDTKTAQNSADYSRALQDYQQRYTIFRNNQNDPWAKLQDLAKLGQNAAIQK